MPEWLQILLCVLLIVAAVVAAVWGMERWNAYEDSKMDACRRAGYADRIDWSGKWFCIGYDREGGVVVEEWEPLWQEAREE